MQHEPDPSWLLILWGLHVDPNLKHYIALKALNSPPLLSLTKLLRYILRLSFGVPTSAIPHMQLLLIAYTLFARGFIFPLASCLPVCRIQMAFLGGFEPVTLFPLGPNPASEPECYYLTIQSITFTEQHRLLHTSSFGMLGEDD